MSTRKLRQKDGAVYFATFSCHEWVPLFTELQACDIVYNWMRDMSRQEGSHTVWGKAISAIPQVSPKPEPVITVGRLTIPAYDEHC
jgi:hypothetical protein